MSVGAVIGMVGALATSVAVIGAARSWVGQLDDRRPRWRAPARPGETAAAAGAGLARARARTDAGRRRQLDGLSRMSDDHYDVIVIGSGAGGGTLAHRLAPAGKRVLLLERGGYLPRERDNWDSGEVFVRGEVPAPRVLVRPAPQRVPARGQLLRRRQHEVLRGGAVPAAAGGLRRAASTTTGSRRPGRSTTPTSSRTTPRPSTSTGCTGGTARTRSRARTAPTTRTRRSSTSRASSSCPTTWRSRACIPSTCRSASTSTRTPTGWPSRGSVCIRCDRVDGFPCLVAGEVRLPGRLRRPGRRQRRRRAADRRVRRAARDRRRRAVSVTGVVVRLDGDAGAGHVQRGHRGRRLRCGELRRAAAALRERRATRPVWPTAPTSSAATTCGTTTSRMMARLEGAQPDPVPEDAGAARLVLRRRGLGLPARRHPDARQVRRRADQGRSAPVGRARSRPACRSRCSPTTRSTSGSAARTCRCPPTASRCARTAASSSRSTRSTTPPA